MTTRTELIKELRLYSCGWIAVKEAADMLEADGKLRAAARLALDALRQASRAATDVDLLCACECAIAKLNEALQ